MDTSNMTPKMAKDLANFIEDFENEHQHSLSINVGSLRSSITFLKETENLTLEDLDSIVVSAMHTYDLKLMSYKSLKGIKSRRKEIIQWLQLFCFLGWRYGFSKISIGRYLIKHHATVIHSIKVIENYRDIRDKEYQKIVNHLKNYVKNYVGITTGNTDRQAYTKSIVATLCS